MQRQRIDNDVFVTRRRCKRSLIWAWSARSKYICSALAPPEKGFAALTGFYDYRNNAKLFRWPQSSIWAHRRRQWPAGRTHYMSIRVIEIQLNELRPKHRLLRAPSGVPGNVCGSSQAPSLAVDPAIIIKELCWARTATQARQRNSIGAPAIRRAIQTHQNLGKYNQKKSLKKQQHTKKQNKRRSSTFSANKKSK